MGIPADNASERLIEGIIGEGKSAPLLWLEEQVSDALYRAELLSGAWAVDIGVWGPKLFRSEAVRLIKEIRPEFAHVGLES